LIDVVRVGYPFKLFLFEKFYTNLNIDLDCPISLTWINSQLTGPVNEIFA